MTKDDEAFETPKVRGPRHRRDRSLVDWVGDKDGATNGDVYKPRLKLRDDYPIEYSCEEAVEGRGESLNEVWFRYDYELTLDGEQDPIETRRALEWSLLWNVGVELGLYNCSIDMQQSAPSTRLRQLQQDNRFLGAATDPTFPPSLTRVVALGNDEEDQVNLQASTYISNVLKQPESLHDTVHCSHTDSFFRSINNTETCFSHDTACRPMKGIMNALYIGNERDAENMVLSLVQKVMATSVVRVKGVSRVQYIGDRDEYAKSMPPALTITDSESSTNDSHMQTFGMGIGIAVGTAVVIGLVVGMLVARVVRKRGGKRRDSETNMSVTSIEIVELDGDEKNGTEKEESNVIIVSSMEEGTVDTDDSSEKPEEPQPVDSSIVPVPQPQQQSQSLPSKRRRRRKKKKKKKNKMGLTRSNSVNSMDTITEENEEDEDSDDYYDGSDCESDYSTDNEDQDFQMKRTMSTGSLTSDPSFPLEQVVESPRIKKLPPPPV